MNPISLFKLSIYFFLAFCSLLQISSQETLLPQGLSLILVPLAYFLTEKQKSFFLPIKVANTFGVLAIGLATCEYLGWIPPFGGFGMQDLSDTQFLAGANLMIYLSWIILFLEKRSNYYWGMIVLGIIQVALACLFTNATGFSLLLILFLFVLVWTLILFMIYITTESFQLQTTSAPKTKPEPVNGNSSPKTSFLETGSTWGTIQLEGREKWINRRMVLGYLSTSLASLLVAGLFFMLTPRIWMGANRSGKVSEDAKRLETGFDDKVKLGHLGRLLDSSAQVLEIELFDSNKKKVDLLKYTRAMGYSEPLFRGNVLSKYNQGNWETATDPGRNSSPIFQPHPLMMQQKINLASSTTGHLFALYPISAMTMDSNNESYIEFNREQLIWKLNSPLNSEIMYAAYSPSAKVFGGNLQRPYLDLWNMHSSNFQNTVSRNLQLPEGLNQTKELATQLATEVLNKKKQKSNSRQGIVPGSPELILELVTHLENYLLDDRNFKYTRELDVQNPQVDPIEDFLFNTKKGDCEYFASALTLMCRSLGIPARLSTGFKGAKRNQLNQTYYVEQQHAHAWVEILVSDRNMARWYIFDPTPSSDEELLRDAAQDAGITWEQVKAAFKSGWRNYIVNMTPDRQASLIYAPIVQTFQNLWKIQQQQGWWELLKEIGRAIITPTSWFSQTGFVAILILLIALFRGRRILQYLKRKFSFILGGNSEHRARNENRIAFYEQFKQICQQQGKSKARAQTEQEFALQLQKEWADHLTQEELNQLPRLVTSWYYKIRFGKQTPSEAQIKPVTEQLVQFENQIRQIDKTEHV